MLEYNTIIVNGKKINFTGNAVINIKKDTSPLNEKKFDIDNKSRMIIEISGDVGNIKCDNANILINGNVNKILTKNGNIKCDNVNGKVVCMSLKANHIKGYINTNGDIITETFIGNTSVGKVIDNFIPIKSIDELKEKMIIYHKKHGKGKIKNIYNYRNNISSSVTVDFDNEEYTKTLFIDKIIDNKSLSIIDNSEIEKEYEEEYDKP